MNQQEVLKREFEKKKALIENELITFKEGNVDISIKLDSQIEKLSINGKYLESSTVSLINKAITNSKNSFEKKWTEYLSNYGIKF